MFKIISFYQYTELADPEQIRAALRSECADLNLLGRILLAREGINGAVSGQEEAIELFQTKLWQKFPALTFREQCTTENAYHKLIVKVRDELCTFETATKVQNAGAHLSPQELKRLYDLQENFYLVDARNEYEYQVGEFKGSIKLPIRKFKEFAAASAMLEPLKDKKIILYCTGGVRCEKASSY
ncbi:MAG TPA: rhodanese-like domain-containing protein, partial [Candidatus Nanoarchaeia archaeon]|nr:rhodanese-like domain-containing protein [Candidatus Nanoarchaeia archaeon]